MMQLPENTTVERSGNTLKVEMTVLPDLLYFNGHFPNTPVLAGVVQVGWVMTLLEREFAIKPLFKGMKLVKFTRLILPNTQLILSLEYQPEKNCVKFQIDNGEAKCASGILMFDMGE